MSASIKELTTQEVSDCLINPDYSIVDIRPVDAYNGWKRSGEHRGGHIKNARSLPLKWAGYIDWIEIVRSKGILPENSIVIYGYNSNDTDKVVHRFLDAGYQNISVYHHFVDEWTINPDLPMDHLHNYKHLVYPEWVKELIDGGDPNGYCRDKYVICHAHYRNPDVYFEGHIPGAVSLDTNLLESEETWNRRTPEELNKVLCQLGIDSDTTVVLYGRFTFPDNDDPFPGSSAGQLGAMRCAFIMLYAGVKEVKILNGGVQSWLDAGYELVTEETLPVPVISFGADIPVNPHLAVDVPQAKEILQSRSSNLVSIRSWREFIGEVSGYNYIEKKGRIPGAVFGNCGTDAYHMENYRNLDHTIREYHEIMDNWKETGITPDKKNAFYCGTGWRGSEAFMNAWLMGWDNIAVFDGGWFEWSNDPNNPFETGEPE